MKAEVVRLRADDYPILKDIEEGTVPDPRASIAIVALSEGKPVGRMLLIAPAHIEGTWVAPEFRNSTVGFRMMRCMEEESKKSGLTKLFCYSPSEEVDGYLSRMGYTKCPVTVWAKDL